MSNTTLVNPLSDVKVSDLIGWKAAQEQTGMTRGALQHQIIKGNLKLIPLPTGRHTAFLKTQIKSLTRA